MLPPALFYALGFALVFFGVLRLVYLGKASPSQATSAQDTEADDESDAALDDSPGSSPPPKRGIGLVGFMSGGRMSGPKRHKVMGVLWIVMGLYVGWTGVVMSRNQDNAQNQPGQEPDERVRVIRAHVDRGEPTPATAPEAPTLKAAPKEPAAAPAP